MKVAIRANGRKKGMKVYHNDELRRFEYVDSNGDIKGAYSFEYVARAYKLLASWLADNGGAGGVWLDSDTDSIAGLKKYEAMRRAVEWHCMTRAADCDALLHPELALFEGLEMYVYYIGGRHVRGVLKRQGQGVLTHKIVKNGKNHGAIVKPWDVTGYKIILGD
jgi:hypothetical protein